MGSGQSFWFLFDHRIQPMLTMAAGQLNCAEHMMKFFLKKNFAALSAFVGNKIPKQVKSPGSDHGSVG